jgi:Carbohydrate binding domain
MKLIQSAGFFLFVIAAIPSAVADAPSAPPATPLISNGGFESGIAGWSIFVPDESKSANCRFDVGTNAPHSGVNCVRLQSDAFARFGIGTAFIPVQPGEHYHVSVWIKADPDAQIRPAVPGITTPGFVVRLYLRLGSADAEGGHLFIGPGNRVTRNAPADAAAATLPTSWTQIEAVVEIPTGVDGIGPALFAWWSQGSIYADDFSIEKVDASTPATPLWTKSPAATP